MEILISLALIILIGIYIELRRSRKMLKYIEVRLYDIYKYVSSLKDVDPDIYS